MCCNQTVADYNHLNAEPNLQTILHSTSPQSTTLPSHRQFCVSGREGAMLWAEPKLLQWISKQPNCGANESFWCVLTFQWYCGCVCSGAKIPSMFARATGDPDIYHSRTFFFFFSSHSRAHRVRSNSLHDPIQSKRRALEDTRPILAKRETVIVMWGKNSTALTITERKLRD